MAASTAAGSLRLRSVAHAQGAPDGDAQFIAFKATMRIPIAPVFASRGDNHIPAADGGMDGVREVLAGWVMRCASLLASDGAVCRPVHSY